MCKSRTCRFSLCSLPLFSLPSSVSFGRARPSAAAADAAGVRRHGARRAPLLSMTRGCFSFFSRYVLTNLYIYFFLFFLFFLALDGAAGSSNSRATRPGGLRSARAAPSPPPCRALPALVSAGGPATTATCRKKRKKKRMKKKKEERNENGTKKKGAEAAGRSRSAGIVLFTIRRTVFPGQLFGSSQLDKWLELAN